MRESSTVRALAGALVAAGAATAAMLALAAVAPAWQRFAPATCLPADCFCEALAPGPIRQPANTWSNLAFILVGGAILGAGGSRGFAALAIFLGAGSMLYHASLTKWGQWIDNLSMYVLPSFLLVQNLRLPERRRWAVFFLVVGVVGALTWFVPETRRGAFALLLCAFIASESRIRRDRRWLLAAAGVFVVALAVWVLDIRRILCSPASLVQGHALWHVLNAAAVACLYRYTPRASSAGAATPC